MQGQNLFSEEQHRELKEKEELSQAGPDYPSKLYHSDKALHLFRAKQVEGPVECKLSTLFEMQDNMGGGEKVTPSNLGKYIEHYHK